MLIITRVANIYKCNYNIPAICGSGKYLRFSRHYSHHLCRQKSYLSFHQAVFPEPFKPIATIFKDAVISECSSGAITWNWIDGTVIYGNHSIRWVISAYPVQVSTANLLVWVPLYPLVQNFLKFQAEILVVIMLFLVTLFPLHGRPLHALQIITDTLTWRFHWIRRLLMLKVMQIQLCLYYDAKLYRIRPRFLIFGQGHML
jgi:hypothetical protein